MKLSVVVPLFNHAENIYSFIDEVDARAQTLSDVHEIIVTTNQDFEFVEKLHDRLKGKAHIIAVRESDDYQQVVMAGVDRASGDATIIMTPEYAPELMDDMVNEWRAGKEVVCLRRKHGKFGQFITKMRLKIYNLFLFMFGDIFSIGILKDAQLLDKKIVDKMKAEQDLAHRIRTMYAPLDCNTAVFNIDHSIEKFETKGTPKFDFWLGATGAVVTLLAMITAFALAGALHAPIWFWTIVIIFGLIFEFVFIALLVNATARVKIGILHNVDEQGRIYNAVQEYHKENSFDEKTEQSQILLKTEPEPKKSAASRKTATKKAVTEKPASAKKAEKADVSHKVTGQETKHKEPPKNVVAKNVVTPKDEAVKNVSATETTRKAASKKVTAKTVDAEKENAPKQAAKKVTKKAVTKSAMDEKETTAKTAKKTSTKSATPKEVERIETAPTSKVEDGAEKTPKKVTVKKTTPTKTGAKTATKKLAEKTPTTRKTTKKTTVGNE